MDSDIILLDMSYEEALAFNAVGAIFTHLPQEVLVKVQRDFEAAGVDFGKAYLSLVKKFDHHLHEMEWCPGGNECATSHKKYG